MSKHIWKYCGVYTVWKALANFELLQFTKKIENLEVVEDYSWEYSMREKCPYSEFFWSVFSRIQTRKTPNMDTFHTVNNLLVQHLYTVKCARICVYISTTMVIILWEFLMFYQILLSPHWNEAWLLVINWYTRVASRIAERLKT